MLQPDTNAIDPQAIQFPNWDIELLAFDSVSRATILSSRYKSAPTPSPATQIVVHIPF